MWLIREAIVRVAIVGGGIYGATVAIVLARNGHTVTLLERSPDILLGASGVNQCRLHRGRAVTWLSSTGRTGSTYTHVPTRVSRLNARIRLCLRPMKSPNHRSRMRATTLSPMSRDAQNARVCD